MRILAIAEETDPAADIVVLDFDERSRRRARFKTRGGLDIILDQEQSRHLRGGQGFILEDGRQVRIEAREEALTRIACDDLATFARIAWHLGNRHLPTQVAAGSNGGDLIIRTDHVIEAMAAQLGGTCSRVRGPFDPEGGAYGPAGGHRDHHHHGHHADHDHDR